MAGKAKLLIGLAGLYLLLTLLFGALGVALWADMQDGERQAMQAVLQKRFGLVVLVTLLSWAILGLIARVLYRAYVQAPLALREQALVMVRANPALRLQGGGAPEIRTLAEAVNALADQREALERDVEERVRQARATVEEERNRLAALMSELTQSVVVCNLDGRILLYNNRARLQFQVLGDGGGLIGLGRSIFAVMERHVIAHALEQIRHRLARGSARPSAAFVTTTRAGQLIRVHMAPVLGSDAHESAPAQAREPQIGGYLLMLENITRNVEAERRRGLLLQSLTEGSRAAMANIRAAVENLLEYPDMDTGQRTRFVGIIRDEATAMSQRLEQASSESAGAAATRWPLEDMLGADLVQAAQRRIERELGLPVEAVEVAGDLWLEVDSYSLLHALTWLASRLQEALGIRTMQFRLARDARLAQLDLLWPGLVEDAQALAGWEGDAMHLPGEAGSLTLREVIDRHGGELWVQRDEATNRSFFRLLIPIAVRPEAIDSALFVHSESRPEYYDFDLFRQTDETRALDERRLTELTYTVFDTETTGLDPSGGDEIIQIGAARIVNGRLLRTECIDQLIDPRRRIRPESIPIHGITEEMLRGQPAIGQVLPTFHAFCEDTVLVAHNAAFDMRFLQMKEAATGVVFRQPVLDTLLLSAVIHPNQASHRLEAIAERLGINVIGRHTALGDAIVTGEVFLRMIPLLAEQGIHTLREAREAAERTYYARVTY
ncbi:MAG: DNA polymerase III subunit epsilon [Burkholderiaceae bacterium]|nr:DNA polymerase III subunit epsilon [Burkholderiaceae bacterium]